MNKRINVLQLQPDYHENSHNYSDLAEQIIAAFPKDRYTVTSAFLRGKPEPSHPKSCADETVYFDFPDAVLSGLRLKLMYKIYRFCKKNRYDVIICNRYKQTNLLMILNRWLHTPVCVGIAHGFGAYDPFWRRQRMKALVDESWRFVGVSPAVAHYLLEKNCGFTKSNTVAITNALDIQQVEANQLSRTEARHALGLPSEPRIIGAAGRLVRIKGHSHLVEAFSYIAAKHTDAMLAIIGEGRERLALEQQIERLGLQGRVYLLGFRAGAKQYMRAFDIWTMPSLNEGLGLALLEGMAGHLPIIGSGIPAMQPLILGAGGISVAPGDNKELACALDDYLSLPPNKLQEKGERAFSYVSKHHNIDAYRKAYLTLVEEALANKTDRYPSKGEQNGPQKNNTQTKAN